MKPTRTIRRSLVLISLVLYALIFIPSLISFALIFGVVAAQLVLFVYAGHVGKHTAVMPDETLDERQLEFKQRVFRQSYYVIMALAAVLVVVNALTVLPGWVTVAFLMLILTLPTYMLLWLEPDPIEENNHLERRTT